jgi:hypothetical protein
MKIAAVMAPLLVVAIGVYLLISCAGQLFYEYSPNTVEDAQLEQRYEALYYLATLNNAVHGNPALAAALNEVLRMITWQRNVLNFEQANRWQGLLR